jgi:Asparagine synthase/Glutamine amidotransferase domain
MSILGGFVGGRPEYTEELLSQALETHPASRISSIRMETRVVSAADAVIFVHDIPGKVGQARINNHDHVGINATLGIYRHKTRGEQKLPAEAFSPDFCSSNGAGLENLEGEYVAVAYCQGDRSLHIVNDRFAARPFYYTYRNETLYFCSSLSFLIKLARIPALLDPLGCLSTGACGHLLSDLSIVKDVTKLPPASHLIAREGKITRKRYWKLKREVDQQLDACKHAQRMYVAFEDSMLWRCALSDSGLIALSGGMDSRLLAAVASKHAGYRAFTFVDSDTAMHTMETECASQVASRLGIPHDIRRLNIDNLAHDVRDVSLLVDGSVPIHHPLKVLSMIRASADAGKYLMGGAPGDVSAGSKIPGLEYLDPEKKEALTTTFREDRISPRSVLSEYFRPNVLDEYYPKLESLVSETLGSYDVSTAAERVTLWSIEHRWPHFQFTSPIHNHPVVSESSPFLGYEYNNCLLEVPAEWLYQRNFYFFMIYQSLPHLRDIAYANTGKPLDGRLREFRYRPNIALRAARQARRQIGTLRSLITKEKAKAGPEVVRYEGHILRSDPRIFEEVRAILENSHPLAEIYDIQKCLSQLDKFEHNGDLGPMPNRSLEVLGALISQAYYVRELT